LIYALKKILKLKEIDDDIKNITFEKLLFKNTIEKT